MNVKNMLAAAVLALSVAPAVASDFHPVIGTSVTGGGKTLVEIRYDDGTTRKITSGGLVHVFGGVEYRRTGEPWAVQANIGYHFDSADAENGSMNFSRMPVELLGFWYPGAKVRLGGGLRKAVNSRFETSGLGDEVSPDFNMRSSLGFVLQGEYFFTEGFSMLVRYVNEDYKSNFLIGGEVDGDHGGLGLSYRF